MSLTCFHVRVCVYLHLHAVGVCPREVKGALVNTCVCVCVCVCVYPHLSDPSMDVRKLLRCVCLLIRAGAHSVIGMACHE